MQVEQSPGSSSEAAAAPQPADQATGQAGLPDQAAGQAGLQDQAEPAEPKVFRMGAAVVAWWAWVALAAAALVDMALTGRDHTSVEITVTLAVVTGVMYTCALRPVVIADSGGITVRNPLRDHKVPWGSVTAVDLRESVRVHCAKEPGAQREKIIHSWALYAQRRSQVRAEMLEQRNRGRSRTPYDRAPAEAQRLSRQPMAQIMAAQLDELARKARERGAVAGPRTVTWAWQPAAAILVPVLVLVLVITLTH
jgi:Bacterial PH domain